MTRILGSLFTLVGATFLIFGALYIAPGSPIDVLIGNRSVSPAARLALERQYGLDKPFFVQYGEWISGIFHGQLGTSVATSRPVTHLIAHGAETTILLVAMATVMTVVLGLGIGIAAALRGGVTEAGATAVTSIMLAVPGFVAATILLYLFAAELGWFPIYGPGDGFFDRLWHLTLPAAALAVSLSAFTARITRTALGIEMQAAHVETAQMRGLKRVQVFRRHIFRNALIPVVTVTGLTLANMIGATVVVEQVFQLNGLGSLLVTSVGRDDFPVIQGVSLVIVAFVVVVNTAVDMSYPLLDPRIRVKTAG